MFENRTIAVVVPAYREQDRIAGVVNGLPDWVDAIVVVDDASPDNTSAAVRALNHPRVHLVRNPSNLGVGGATINGLKKARELGADLVVKMDGDGQMDPAFLEPMLRPLARGTADYTKGNRLRSLADLGEMPRVRLLGNAALTFLVKLASGYWHISDPQNGFLALRTDLLRQLDLDGLDRGYYFEDDILVGLNIVGARVADVPMPARYLGRHSSLSPWRMLFYFPPRLLRSLLRRFWLRYVLYDFSPVALLVFVGLPLFLFGITWGAVSWHRSLATQHAEPTGTVMLAVLPIILGTQFLVSALHLDIQNSPRGS